jgi:calcineurin-like phosphoesterase family protein
MNEGMIQRFNEVLRPGDVLWHLGDIKHSQVTFDNTLGRLNTKEIHLVLGNHDKENECARWGGFRSISRLRSTESGSIVLCHYALRTWPGKNRGGMQLYGHSHGTLPGLGRQMDVGVDTNNFYPYNVEEIRDCMNKIEFNPEAL